MTNLVEFKSIEQVVQLSVLRSLVDLDEVLLEPVEGQFRLIVDIDLQRLEQKRAASDKYRQ